MKLHTKILLGFGTLWAVLVVATIVVLVGLKGESTSLEDTFRNNFDSDDYCHLMIISLDKYNQAALGVIWTHLDPPADSIKEYRAEFEHGAEGQRHNVTLPGEGKLTDAALKNAQEFQDAFAAFLAAPVDRRVELYQSTLFPRYIAARASIQAVIDLNFAHLRKTTGSLQSNLSNARDVQIVFALIGAASAIVSILVLRKTILGPLQALTDSTRRVEAGNLDFTVPVRAKDELGDLAVAFNAMAAKLREYRQLDHERLRRTQQTTQLAIDSLPDAVAVLNRDGQVEISNYQARTHFGLSPEGSGKNAFPDWLSELVAGPLATGSAVEPMGYHSAVQLFDNGVERFLLPRAVPMFGEKGAIIGVVVTLVDVTRLRRADEIKSGLVSTVSHELKTPLAAARFSAHLLAQESIGPLDEKQRRLVKAACEGTDRLHRIIEDLLQFQRFEEGRQTVQMAVSNPKEIVARATGELREEFLQKGLELAVEAEPDVPMVSADADLVNHVLTNLLSNALKFVPTGGHVKVGVAAVGGQVRFSVSDDGPGIPAQHIPKLFSRFYRAAAPTDIPGAGLGLSIARQLIEAQGGTISYEPVASGGARFLFQLRKAGGEKN